MMHCRICGVLLEQPAAQVIGVCHACIQDGGRMGWPAPPGYGWNPTDDTRREPPRPE